jgi:hypothetical protein
VALEVGKRHVNAERAEHREKGCGMALDGIKERAVPVKEYGADIVESRGHR